LSDPTICDVLDESDTEWSGTTVLGKAAAGSYHSLINTGVLVTGFSGLEVAQYLLKIGKLAADSETDAQQNHSLRDRDVQGVVYLDEADQKICLVPESGTSVRLDECGLKFNSRFAFYDQVNIFDSSINQHHIDYKAFDWQSLQIHTTGMDIKHTPNATALVMVSFTYDDHCSLHARTTICFVNNFNQSDLLLVLKKLNICDTGNIWERYGSPRPGTRGLPYARHW